MLELVRLTTSILLSVGTVWNVVGKRVELSASFGESGRDDGRLGGRAIGVGTAVDWRTHKVIIVVDIDERYRSAGLESSWKTSESSSGGSERATQGT